MIKWKNKDREIIKTKLAIHMKNRYNRLSYINMIGIMYI